MELYFKTKKLQKICNSEKQAKQELGDRMARLLMRRLAELNAAPNLEAMRKLPQARCHELTGGARDGQISVDLEHPLRFIFIPANDPLPRRSDGGLDWLKVTEVEIVEIADTHKKGR